jgi:hypothetical protein
MHKNDIDIYQYIYVTSYSMRIDTINISLPIGYSYLGGHQ